VPLDVTRQVTFGLDEIGLLPDDNSPIGSLLQKLLPALFRAYRQQLGLESVNLNDAVALLAVTHSELFETEEMEGMIETAGEITRGVTVFDRRPGSVSRSDMEVAVSVDAQAARDTIIKGLQRAALGF
jgi:inosine-uridine nucleoside N-ribohydrolase